MEKKGDKECVKQKCNNGDWKRYGLMESMETKLDKRQRWNENERGRVWKRKETRRVLKKREMKQQRL